MIWVLWITVYTINNGMITWLPTLYTPGVRRSRWRPACSTAGSPPRSACVASVVCALLHRQGRPQTLVHRRRSCSPRSRSGRPHRARRHLRHPGPDPGATIAYAILQTIAFSLYLYSAELYPTRLRAIGTGFGSAWLRAGSSIGPVLVGFIVAGVGIRYVFLAFAVIAVIGGRHRAVRHRDQGQGPRRTLALTSVVRLIETSSWTLEQILSDIGDKHGTAIDGTETAGYWTAGLRAQWADVNS